MTATIHSEGKTCLDCTIWIANADDSGMGDAGAWRARVESTNPTDNGRLHAVNACAEDCGGEFRYDECAFCGINEYGDWHPVVFFHNP